MLYIKMLSVFVVTTIIFICCDKTPSTAGNGSETENAFSGRILYEDGSPAAGVSVRVLPVDNVPSIAAAKSMVVTTDSNGYYNVAGLDSGLYNVEGLKDTLGVFIDSITVKASPSIPDGVLKKVGEVTGVTHMEGQTDTNQVRVTLYMPGTSRITKPVIGGRFNFDNMPEGSYQLIIDPLPQYNVKVMSISVMSGQVLDLDTIRLGLYEPDTIDITTSTVYGTWGPNKTYRVFNEINVATGMSLVIKPNTQILFMSYFGLSANGALIIEGKKDSFIVFRSGLANPVNTSWRGINIASDTLIMRYCRVENVSAGVMASGSLMDVRNCVFQGCHYPLYPGKNSIIANNVFIDNERAVCFGQGNHLVLNNIFSSVRLAFQGNPAFVDVRYNDFFNVDTAGKYGTDMPTWSLPPFTSNISVNPDFIPGSDFQLSAVSGCRGTGFKGMDMGIYDTLRDGYIADYIVQHSDVPSVFAGNDTTVFINDSVHLSGQSSSQLGNIVKWEWDIGNTGSFISLPSGIYSYKAPAAPSTQTCIFRATDNDGSVASDSLKVTYDPDSNFIKLNSFGMKLIPAGTFTDLQGKTASISYPFFIDSTEVTQNRFESITGCNPSVIVGAQKPVTNISFYLAAIYCNMLSKTCGLDTVYDYTLLSQEPFLYLDSAITNFVCRWDRSGFRLPTEDEWTLACMGGTGNFFYWGNEKDSLFSAQFAWTEQMPSTLHDVAQLSPNSYHLYDMIGNVREFCFGGNCDHPTRTDFICDREYYCMAMGGHYAALLDSTTIREEVTRYQMSNYRGFRCVRLAK